MVKALVLGATGHIGNAVVRELLAQGYQVTATSRRKEPAANLAGLPVCYAPGNSDTPGQLDAWIAGHDVVVDAAAPYPLRLYSTTNESESRPLDYALQRAHALLDAVFTHNARFVYVSSFVTLSRPREGFEGWRNQLARRLHPYFAVKEGIEAQVLAAARNGLPAVIVNPTMCLGPWDVKDRDLCFIPRLLCGEIPVAVQHLFNVIDVRDVATGLVAALHRERYGEPILLSGHNIPINALFSWICEIGGVKPPPLSAPLTLSLLTTYWLETWQTFRGELSSLSSLALMLACQHEWMTPSTAQCDLGVTLRPLSETLQDAVAWYRTLGYC